MSKKHDKSNTKSNINTSIIKSVGAKCLFLQPQLLRNIDSIIQNYYNFFSDDATIIYLMKEINSCFFKNCK